MALKVEHDGSGPGDQREHCCMCRELTRFWHRSDVALCEPCAKTTKLSELPTKADWCAKEAEIYKRSRFSASGRAQRTNNNEGEGA